MILLRSPGVYEDKIVGLEGSGHVQKSQNHENEMRVFGPSHNKIEKLLDQKIDENNFPELLNLLFK